MMNNKRKTHRRIFNLSYILIFIIAVNCGFVINVSAVCSENEFDYELEKNLLKDAVVFGDGIVESQPSLPAVTLINGAPANTKLWEECIVDGSLFNQTDTPKFGTSSTKTFGAIRIKLKEPEIIGSFVLTTRKDKNGFGNLNDIESLTFGYGNNIGGYGPNGFANEGITVTSYTYGDWKRITLALNDPVEASDILIGGINRESDVNIVETELYRFEDSDKPLPSISVLNPTNREIFSAGTRKIRLSVGAFDAHGIKLKYVDFFKNNAEVIGSGKYNADRKTFEYVLNVCSGKFSIYAKAESEIGEEYISANVMFSIDYDVQIWTGGNRFYKSDEAVTLTAAVKDRYNSVSYVRFEHNGTMLEKVPNYIEKNGYKYYICDVSEDRICIGSYRPYAYDAYGNLICEAQSVAYYTKGYANVAFKKPVSAASDDGSPICDNENSRVSSLTDGRLGAYIGKNSFKAKPTETKSVIFDIDLQNNFEISGIMLLSGEADGTKTENVCKTVSKIEVFYFDKTQWVQAAKVENNTGCSLYAQFDRPINTELIRIKASVGDEIIIREAMAFTSSPISSFLSEDDENYIITVSNNGIYNEKCRAVFVAYRNGKPCDIKLYDVDAKPAVLIGAASQWGNDAIMVPSEYLITVEKEDYDGAKLIILRDMKSLRPITNCKTVNYSG